MESDDWFEWVDVLPLNVINDVKDRIFIVFMIARRGLKTNRWYDYDAPIMMNALGTYMPGDVKIEVND